MIPKVNNEKNVHKAFSVFTTIGEKHFHMESIVSPELMDNNKILQATI